MYANAEKKAYVTISLVTLNIVAYLYLIYFNYRYLGDWQIDNTSLGIMATGGLVKNSVLVDYQWYRVITSMFLQFNLVHLITNMITLYYLGIMVEKYLGHFKYLFLYFGSGLVANLFSLYFQNVDAVSAGASGAIFGIFAFFILGKWYLPNQPELAQLGKTYAILILLNLALNITDTSVNMIAHVMGFLSGLAIMGIYIFFAKNKRFQKY